MKSAPWWVLVAVGVVAVGGLVALWQSQGGADEVDSQVAVPAGANAPTSNQDLENLRHIKEMSSQQGE